MAIFQYIARTAGGDEVSGVMQADNESAVVRTLDEKKLFPVRVTAQQSAARTFGGTRIRGRELGMLYGQMADLLRSGVPLLRTLETLARAISNRRLAGLVTAVKDDVAAGKTLADAMAARPEAFASLHCAMVRAGERAGFLEDVLSNLARFLEQQDELRGKVIGSLIYPAVLCVIGTLAVTMILTFLVPQFRNVFAAIPNLPLPTMVLFAASDLLTGNWMVLVAVLLLIGGGLHSLLRSQAGRLLWDAWRLRVPLLGKVLRVMSIARFCRIFGTLLANGVPILQALGISKDAAGCSVLSAAIEKAIENVRAGEPLVAPLRASGMFPPEVLEMIGIAEESNQLEKVLVQIADTVERRMNRQVELAVRLIEPLMLVGIAAVLGFIALGLLYPMFTMASQLK